MRVDVARVGALPRRAAALAAAACGVAGEPLPDPRDLLAVRPWRTLRGLARATVRDPRLRMVVERFATYAGADPRRAPAALAVAGYVEHAFGAWHVRGGIHEIVRALVRRLEALGGELELGTGVRDVVARDGRVRGVETAAGERRRRRRRVERRRAAGVAGRTRARRRSRATS